MNDPIRVARILMPMLPDMPKVLKASMVTDFVGVYVDYHTATQAMNELWNMRMIKICKWYPKRDKYWWNRFSKECLKPDPESEIMETFNNKKHWYKPEEEEKK